MTERPPLIRWLRVKNADTQPVPPRGVVAITGVADDGSFTVARPTADGQQGVLFNGPTALPPGQTGQAHTTYPAVAAYVHDPDTGDDPEVGDPLGVVAGEWSLQAGREGFVALGGASGGFVNVTGTFYPDASPTVAHGVVTNEAQEFAGVKTFDANVLVQDIVKVGALLADGVTWTYVGWFSAQYGNGDYNDPIVGITAYTTSYSTQITMHAKGQMVLSSSYQPAVYAIVRSGNTLDGIDGTLADGSVVSGGIVTGPPTGTFVTGVSGGTTGLTLTGTTTLTIGGTLVAGNGGTGLTTSGTTAGAMLVSNGSGGWTTATSIDGGTW